MADPHTDDLADRLDEMHPLPWDSPQVPTHQMPSGDYCWRTVYDANGESVASELTDEVADFMVAAAAELRRLRHRDAALTTLLDAVGPTDIWWVCANLEERTDDATRKAVACLRRIAAAVEAIDREHER